MRVGTGLAFAMLVLFPEPACAQREVTPPDVHAQVRTLRAELELIRVRLGRPADERPALDVRQTAPREVYFQARALEARSRRLAFELTRRRRPALEARPADSLRPADVLDVVRSARAQIQLLLDQLEISEAVPDATPDPSHEPTDVYRAIVAANRQLNLLTEEPYSPSDVYMHVTTAMSYTARLLSLFPEVRRIPHAPPFEADREPGHVYRRLLECFAHIARIAELSEVSIMEIVVPEEHFAHVIPSDVYDLASLLVSELAYFHALHGGLRPVIEPYRPHPRTPPHVHQRAGILNAQLEMLVGLVEEWPVWIGER